MLYVHTCVCSSMCVSVVVFVCVLDTSGVCRSFACVCSSACSFIRLRVDLVDGLYGCHVVFVCTFLGFCLFV